MKVKYFLFFIFIATFSNAQISGYMGKRLIIGYSNYFMLGFRGPGSVNSAPFGEASPTINNVNCLNLEYVYKQNKMICLSGQYMRTGIAYDNGTGSTFFTRNNPTPYPGSTIYSGDYSKPALVTSVNFSLALKTFKRGFIAPLGRYRKMEVLVLFEKVKYDYKNFSSPDPNVSYAFIKRDLGTGQYSYRNMVFAYTLGKQRAIKDKIILDYGLRFAYTPAINILTLTSGDDNSTTVYKYFRRGTNLRIAYEQLINIHLGIGFLAF